MRRADVVLSEEDKAALRRLVTTIVCGLGEANQRAWLRLWARMWRMEPGEVQTIWTHKERLGWFHRKHMALETRVFEGQERFESFESFRDWLKIGAGHVEWHAGPRGGIVPIPKSISYARLGQDEMEEFHAAAVAFLRTERAAKWLWPRMPAAQRQGAMDAILGAFGAFGEG